jgi:phage baseplate assembly protein W
MKYINIDFPFKNSTDGSFLKMNDTHQEAIKADLMHLLLTYKNQRFYSPDFGTNLSRYIFEMNDGITSSDIVAELNNSIKKYMPNLEITSITSNPLEDSTQNLVQINYNITEDALQLSDEIKIML